VAAEVGKIMFVAGRCETHRALQSGATPVMNVMSTLYSGSCGMLNLKMYVRVLYPEIYPRRCIGSQELGYFA
jgi:hypothetical protein